LGLDKRTGKTLWESGTSAQAHLSPVSLDIDGQRGVFFALGDFVVVRPSDGKVLCKTDRRSLHWSLAGPVYRDAIVHENFMEFSGFLLKMEEGKFSVAQMGDKRNLGYAHACYSNQLFAKGCLFSSHSYDTANKGVNIKLEDEGYRCRDFKTGEVKWEKRGDLAGTQILVDGKIVMLVKNGQLVVFDADPTAYKELARLPIFEGYKDGVDGYQCVTSPAFLSGHILLRKGDEVVCVDAR
jgi:outer membrane protein assembly factor BamB